MPWSCHPGPRTWQVSTSVRALHSLAGRERCAAFRDAHSSPVVFEVNTLLSVILPEASAHSGLERSQIPCCQRGCKVPKLKTENNGVSWRCMASPQLLHELGCAQPLCPLCVARAGVWRPVRSPLALPGCGGAGGAVGAARAVFRPWVNVGGAAL